MKKKIYLFAFMLCILTSGIILTACGGSPILEFKEGETLTREYNGSAISSEEVMSSINVSDGQELTINFYQGETLVDAPINVGDYKVVISIPSKTIDQEFSITKKSISSQISFVYNGQTEFSKALSESEGICNDDDVKVSATFDSKNVGSTATSVSITGEDKENYSLTESNIEVEITPKALSNLTSTVIWMNRAGEREVKFASAAAITVGVISGDDATAKIFFESYDLNAEILRTEVVGADCGNYIIPSDEINIRHAIGVKITTEDLSKNTTVYMVYGENKLYTSALANIEVTQEYLQSKLGLVKSIYLTYEGLSDGEREILVSFGDDGSCALIANAKYSASDILTDANGNWIAPNGKNSAAINFTAEI